MSSGQEYCVYCDKHVAAVPENRVGPDFSASSVRPPMYAHPNCYRPTPRSTARAGR